MVSEVGTIVDWLVFRSTEVPGAAETNISSMRGDAESSDSPTTICNERPIVDPAGRSEGAIDCCQLVSSAKQRPTCLCEVGLAPAAKEGSSRLIDATRPMMLQNSAEKQSETLCKRSHLLL